MNKSEKENELTIIAQGSNLSTTRVQELLSQFGEPYQEASKVASEAKSIAVTDEKDTETMGKARAIRLQLKKIRIGVEKTRKDLGEESLRERNAINGMANIIKALVVPVEEYLEKQEKFAETQAAERKHARHIARVEELSQFVNDISVYALDDMSDEAYTELLSNAKQAKADKIAAEKKAEEDRVAAGAAEKKHQEEERLENERLRKEAEAKEAKERKLNDRLKQLSTLGLKWDGEQYVRDDINVHHTEISTLGDADFAKLITELTNEITRRVEAAAKAEVKRQAEAEKERKAEAEKLAAERKVQEEKLAAERKTAEDARKRSESLEREKKEREADDARIKAEEEAKQHAALLAPDKEKLESLANIIDNLAMPHVSNREAIAVLNETVDFLNRISKNLRKKAKEL